MVKLTGMNDDLMVALSVKLSDFWPSQERGRRGACGLLVDLKAGIVYYEGDPFIFSEEPL